MLLGFIVRGKICRKCGVHKSFSEFHAHPILRDGYSCYCKDCKKKHYRGYKEDKDKRRNYQYKNLYGITLDDYNTMLKNQQYKCSICGKHKNNLERNLSVDHCHKTGKVRGLVCQACNFKIGWLENYTNNITAHLNIKIGVLQ